MTKLIIGTGNSPKLNIDATGAGNHKHLKNLGFEESGHVGFQKELSAEQIENINKIKDKEDLSNKVSELTDNATHEQYPSAKSVFDAIEQKGEWELVKADTLTSSAVVITNTLGNKYKELYIHLNIATMKNDNVSEVPNGRVTVYAGKRYNNFVFEESNPLYGDNGVPFALTFHIELTGKYFRTHRYYKSNSTNTYYTGTAIASTGYADIGQTYIDMLTLEFKPTERKFPAGTTYEIWGVRA